MNKVEVIGKILNAYNLLVSKEGHLFEADANERSLTHKFAEYLQAEFPNWNVDCEYNRNGLDVKRLETFKRNLDSNDTNAITVYPDIIIHRRGTKDNLVVIEVKKTNSTADDLDEEKLKAFKNDLGYKFGYKILFPIRERFESINVSDCITEIK